MTASRASMAQRLQDLVSDDARGPAEAQTQRLETERMIVIN